SFGSSAAPSSPGLDTLECIHRSASVVSVPIFIGSNSTLNANLPGSAGRVPTEYQLRHAPSTPNRINRAASPATRLRTSYLRRPAWVDDLAGKHRICLS